MSAINSENRDSWQILADMASKQRPDPGKRVRVDGGRKYKGKVGTVLRNEQDRFYDVFRYGGEGHQIMAEMNRREGFIVLIRTENGETFWTKANYCTVL